MGVKSGGVMITANTGEDSFFFMNKGELDIISEVKLGNDRNFFGPHGMKADENKKYIYVANSYNRTISIIDCIREEVIDSIGVGTSPCHLDFCRGNHFLYVSNYDSDSIYVLDLDKKVPEFKIAVGRMPHDVKIAGKHNFLYVSESGGESIGIIDTKNNEIYGTIPTGNTPLHLKTVDRGEFIFAGCSIFERGNFGEICIIDTKDQKVIERYRVGNFISDLCICEKKKSIFAVDGESNYIYEIGLDDGRLKRKVETGDFPSCIEIDHENKQLVTATHMAGFMETYDLNTLQLKCKRKAGKDINHFIFFHI